MRTGPKRSVNIMALVKQLILRRVGGGHVGLRHCRIHHICHGIGPISVRGCRRTGTHRRTAVVHTHRVTGSLRLSVGVNSIRFRNSNDGTVFCCVTSRHISFHRLVGIFTRRFHIEVRVGRVNTHRRTKHVNNVNPYNHRLYYAA